MKNNNLLKRLFSIIISDKVLLFLLFIFFHFLFVQAQNRVIPPGQVKPPKKETESTIKPNNEPTKRKSATKSNISNVEIINGITVKWNEATLKQKTVITELLKNMVFVEGGDYVMGATQIEENKNEIPPHLVNVDSFWIDKYELTKKLWDVIMDDDYVLSYEIYYGLFLGQSSTISIKDENYPILINSEEEEWGNLITFIKKLNNLTGLNFGLPTEAEWEYAARGGKFSEGYKFSGSNNLDDVAWHSGNSNQQIHPVGKKHPNELGLYDMSGNVLEWTSDLYREDYNSSPYKDESINTSRGGYYWRSDCHVTVRYYGDVDGGMVGVRLILKTNDSIPNTNDFHNFNYGPQDSPIEPIPMDDEQLEQKADQLWELMIRRSSLVRESSEN